MSHFPLEIKQLIVDLVDVDYAKIICNSLERVFPHVWKMLFPNGEHRSITNANERFLECLENCIELHPHLLDTFQFKSRDGMLDTLVLLEEFLTPYLELRTVSKDFYAQFTHYKKRNFEMWNEKVREP